MGYYAHMTRHLNCNTSTLVQEKNQTLSLCYYLPLKYRWVETLWEKNHLIKGSSIPSYCVSGGDCFAIISLREVLDLHLNKNETPYDGHFVKFGWNLSDCSQLLEEREIEQWTKGWWLKSLCLQLFTKKIKMCKTNR